MNAKRAASPLRESFNKVLGAYADVEGVRGAVLFSDDGFELAAYGVDADLRARLAALGSSLAALGVAISAEAGLHDFERAIFESRDGTILIMRVADQAMSLVVVADKRISVGRALWTAQHCCAALTRITGH